ncbi:MAG: HD domain-containing protein [Weeksellaceae bacterium]|nr:HD domain-containing protein [Weeksellaceae bacterium]
MTTTEILEKVTDFGDKAHGNQLRKYAPDRYMVHPVRVMQKRRTVSDDITVLTAALLHDVIEDTPVNRQEIENYLSTLISPELARKATELVVDLSDVYVKESYPSLNRRQRKTKELERLKEIHPDAQTIKYADILDNTQEIVVKNPAFARVYLREVKEVLQNLTQGNSELHKEALEAVNAGLNQVR